MQLASGVLCPSFLSLFRGTEHPTCLYSHRGLSCHIDRKHREQWLLCETLGGEEEQKKRERVTERGGLDWERLVLTQSKKKKKVKKQEKWSERGRESRNWPPSSSVEHSWLWERRRGWRLHYTLLSGHTVQLKPGLCDGGWACKYKSLQTVPCSQQCLPMRMTTIRE